MNLAHLLNNINELKMYPVRDATGEYKIVFQDINASSLLLSIQGEFEVTTYVIENEEYCCLSHQAFLNCLKDILQQEANIAILTCCIAIILHNIKQSNNSWPNHEETLKDINTHITSLENINWDKVDNLYKDYFEYPYQLEEIVDSNWFEQWKVYFFDISILIPPNSYLSYLCKVLRNILIEKNENLISRTRNHIEILKNFFEECARIKYSFDNMDFAFLTEIFGRKNEKEVLSKYADKFLSARKQSHRENDIEYLSNLYSRLDDSSSARLYFLSKKNHSYYLPYTFLPLEFIIGFLDHHINQTNSSKTTIYYPTATIDYTNVENSITKFIEFLKYLEKIATRNYGYEADNFGIRAVEIGESCLDWIECLIYHIIQAFSNIENHIEEIITLIATDSILAKLEDLTLSKSEDRYQKRGCIIDNILRNRGKRTPIDKLLLSRDLFNPFPSISGRTWMNSFKIEDILFNAAQRGEREFSKDYTDNFHEREDDLIRDLFDRKLEREFAKAIALINQSDKKNIQGKWALKWNKLSLKEEKTKGADLGLKIVVDVEGVIKFEKICFIQVKALLKSGSKLMPKWKIDMRQLNDLIKFTDHSFYLLLTESSVSSDQRIIPADMVKNIIQSSNSKGTLSDTSAVLGARSLSHFLIYEVLSGWQGSQNQELINWNDNRKGFAVRNLLEIELTKKRENG